MGVATKRFAKMLSVPEDRDEEPDARIFEFPGAAQEAS